MTLIGGAALLAILFFVILRTYAQQIAQQSQDRILEASVSSILDAATIRAGKVDIDLPYAAFAMLETSADDRVFYAIHQGPELLTGYKGLRSENGAEARVFSTIGYLGFEVRRVTIAKVYPANPEPILLTASVAQTRDSLAATSRTISVNAALLGGAFFALAVGMALWASSATIRPLNALAGSVARRGPADLRPVVRDVPSELAPLVAALNSLMARLNQSLTQSETFIAEAAHRVRTPLATVRSHAESTLLRVDKDENRQALRTMIRAIDESSRAAGQLLDHAMVTFRSDHLERQDIDLCAICKDTVERLRPLAEMKDLTLILDLDGPASVKGDAILIQNAIRNLLDNALKYSPRDKSVRLTVQTNPRPAIAVIDEGPGFPQQDIEGLSARFKRGENAKDTVGSGLGLTIVQDVAIAHGGKLCLSNIDGGGACAELLL